MEDLVSRTEFYIIGGAVALLPFALYLDRRHKEKRAQKYRRLGMNPVSKQRFRAWVDTRGFEILRKMGRFNRQHEHVIGTDRGHRIGLFTHSVADGSRSGAHQTVAVVELARPGPAFVCRPEWVRDKLKARFGNDDIDFDDDPEFSRRYFLRGEPENEIRALFNEELREMLKAEKRLWLECDGRVLMLFREHERLVKGDKLEAILTRIRACKSLLESGQDGSQRSAI